MHEKLPILQKIILQHSDNHCSYGILAATSTCSISLFTVEVLKFETLFACQKWPRQTEHTPIRLLLKKQSDQGLLCLPFRQYPLSLPFQTLEWTHARQQHCEMVQFLVSYHSNLKPYQYFLCL